ncbi:MAG: DUF6688 family protein [Lachnospiraceae bacterium]
MKKIKEHPVVSSLLLTVLLGLIFTSFFGIAGASIFSWFIAGLVCGLFLVYPCLLTLINLYLLLKKSLSHPGIRTGKLFEGMTIILGSVYSCIVLVFYEIDFTADWMVVLHNNEIHTPIYTQSYVTIILFACIGICGYLLMSIVPLKKMPPLVIVTSISAMYVGIFECILWMIQIFDKSTLLLMLFPFNCILIAIKLIRIKIFEWNQSQVEGKMVYKNRILTWLNKKVEDSKKWPFVAFLLMFPLLGLVVCILVLFGQQPDAFIKAWTETSDWNLSKRVAPQNVFYDEHYLCTVAAGGHKKIVRPQRLGLRHGHEVIVNRQLCIANAFEQILEEKIPRIHRGIRKFYDTYGFPVARLIHSPYIADFIYLLMKPLEWFFLIVIYFCDVKPENRIALQYIPSLPDSSMHMRCDRKRYKQY